MIKIAVLVSGGGTNLQALIDAQKAGAFPNGEDRTGDGVQPESVCAGTGEKRRNRIGGGEPEKLLSIRRIMTGRWWKRCKAAALNWWCWQDF